ncbi:1-acyl-sn-glycerol-3-phosphate acyltransferase [Candidatus Scalindua japonica]|uniref:1-acyl-sn-glycerol-3-phosphate acyltransferase n=2 Tax=Candidatus Scalindua japonica TaxID=1284222 RepID=A0A286TW91_9BACT|nr:1-acyl-sn-glycerol-3-phosphate acyltransferase [Candidatus Scalindua japonica]
MRMLRNIIKIVQLSAYLSLMFIFRILLDFKVKGTDNLKKAGDSFILAVNHVSYLDPISVCLAMPFRFKYFPLFYMAYDYFYDILFFYRFLGAVPAHQGKDLEFSGRQLITLLSRGERAVIFPEGGINKGITVKRRPRRGISYVAAKSDKLILPLKIESNLDGSVNVLGGKVIDLLTQKHWVKIVFGEPFKIEDTIGKIPESLKELRLASENILRRIETTS